MPAIPSASPSAAPARARKLIVLARSVLLVVRELFPWTPLGLLLGVGALLSLRAFAYAELDLVWLVMGYATLGLCALAPLCVLPSLIYVHAQVKRRASPEALHLETGTLAETGFALPSLRFLPLVQVRWEWLSPPTAGVSLRAERGLLREHVSLSERGEHARIVRRVLVEDPFGLARMAFRMPEQRTLRVLPRMGRLSQLPSLLSLAAGNELSHPMGLEDGDRLELSRYTPGDPARFIHWKVFGRTRKLMVRRPERAVAIARRAAAFYIAGDDDDATAAVARLSLTRGLLGREWVFGTDLSLSGTSRVDEALTQLVASVRARASAGRGLLAFLAHVEKRGPASVIVFAPAQPGTWLDAVSSAARKRQVRAVIAVDGVVEAPRRSWLERVLATPPRVSGASALGLEQVVTTLARAGVVVTLLDRSTGRVLSERHRRTLVPAAASLAGALR